MGGTAFSFYIYITIWLLNIRLWEAMLQVVMETVRCSGGGLWDVGLTCGERAILIMVMMGGRSLRVSFKQRSSKVRSFSWG